MSTRKKRIRHRSIGQMIEDYGFNYTLKYFCISKYAISFLIITLFHNILAELICKYFGLNERGSVNELFNNLITVSLPFVLYGLWIYLFFTSSRTKLYEYVTFGRSYYKDHNSFNKTYTELTEFYNEAEPHRFYTDKYPVQNWRKCKGICFGYDDNGHAIYLSADCEYNFAIFGPPGSSKTAGFCNVNAITFPGSCLIVDIKSDLYNYVQKNSKRKIVRFCPDDPDALNISAHFNPLAGIDKMSVTDRKLKIDIMSISLIPDDGGNEGNYFPETARIIFKGVTHLLLFENPKTTFPDIIHAILQGYYADWVYRAQESNCLEAKELLLSLEGNSEKNVSGAYQNLTKRLEVYSNPVLDELLKPAKKNTLSIKTLDSGFDVFLQLSEKHLIAYGPLLTMLINSFSNDFLERPDTSSGAKNRHILMILDELSSLHLSYDILNQNLSKLRSKSVLTAIVTQNLPQLKRLYGQDGAEALLGNCHVQAILGSNDPTTSKYFSEKLGVKKDYRVTTSLSENNKSTTSGKSVDSSYTVPVFRPEDVADIKSENKNILCIDGKYTFLAKLNCYRD